MLHRRYVLLLGALFALALPRDARPCSLIEAPTPGGRIDGATVGARPLLFSVGGRPQVYRADDPTQAAIPLEPADFEPELFIGVQQGSAWRPVAPLSAGEYRMSDVFGDQPFFVDPELVATPPELGPTKLSVVLDEPDEPGCLGSNDSCSDIDFTRFTITLGATTAEHIVLTVENPVTGARRVELVGFSPGEGTPTIKGWDNPGRFPGSLKRDRLCFSLTPISEDGVIGTQTDLGCVRPSDDDPRVDDQRGCAAGTHGLSHLMWWLAALVVARGRLRRVHG